MTSKERMLCALNGEKPDRLPVTIHQWQPWHLKNYMNGMSDIEANAACGLDASINYYEADEPQSTDWKISKTQSGAQNEIVINTEFKTPSGTLSMQQGQNAMTTWVTQPLIKNDDDIYILKKHRPIPKLNRSGAVKTYDALGNGGILRSFIFGLQGGCWQDACELYGVEKLILACFDKPDWVHEFLKILLEQKLAYIDESLPNMPFELIETGGGASSNTVISPDMHEEFCLPYDLEMHKAIKSLGYKCVYHTCGGMSKITKHILQNGCDASETLSPAALGGDIGSDETARQVYDDLHSSLALIGGMDQINLLEKGSAQQIEKEVERLFNLFGKNGGYILSASDHFFEAPRKNLECFAAAAKQFVY